MVNHRGVSIMVLIVIYCSKPTLAKPKVDLDTTEQLDELVDEENYEEHQSPQDIEEISKRKYSSVHGRILAINMASLGKRRLQTPSRAENAFGRIESINDGQHLNLYQGDIQLDEELEEYLHMPIRTRTKRNALRTKKRLWTSKVIPYRVPSFMSYIRSNLMKAISAFHKTTCIRFVPYRPRVHKNYITFSNDDGCSSKVGKRYASPGSQSISIGNGCNHVSIIQHELMHAIGFFHEQSRSDRDRYIRINWENIQKGFSDQFEKYSWKTIDQLGKSYDFQSLVHYDRRAFTKDGKPTIEAIDNPQMDFNTHNRLSAGDIIELNVLYDCHGDRLHHWSSWTGFTPCDNKCYKSRERFCYNSGNMKSCGEKANVYGIETDRRKCTKRECDERFAVHGHWGRWSPWGRCSAKCDEGDRRRFRRCDNPKPGKLGKPCAGEAVQRRICTVRRCKLDYDDTDFDDPTRPLGMWKNKQGSQIYWRRHRGYTQTMQTGPSKDHTTGNGYYLYMESSTPAKNNYKAILTTPLMITKKGGQCLNFYYMMYGRTTGSLEVKLRYKRVKARLFYKYGDQGHIWRKAAISLDFPKKRGFQIDIIATVGRPGYSDIAIDDVFIDDGLCSCQDKYRVCPTWAKKGECQKNKGFMAHNCPRSCKICGAGSGCTDNNASCGGWAKRGECKKNPKYMKVHCKKSCRVCR